MKAPVYCAYCRYYNCQEDICEENQNNYTCSKREILSNDEIKEREQLLIKIGCINQSNGDNNVSK